jgi:hypothetical protein
MSPFRFTFTWLSLSLALDPSITENCGRFYGNGETAYSRYRQTDILQPPPHFHHAHKPFTLDTINPPQDCAKDAKESTTGRSTRGSSAAWNSLDYHQLVSWLSLPQVVIDSLKRGRERRSRSSIRPMKNQAASGVNRRICLVSKMCRLSEEAQQRQPCFFAMIFRLLNGTHAIL